MALDIDEALGVVGGYRRWHLAMFCLLGLTMTIPLAGQGLVIVFIGFTPDHHCQIPEGHEKNGTIPYTIKKGETVWSKCEMFTNGTEGQEKEACREGWRYLPEGGERTIVMEWDLVCEYNYMAELSQTLYQVGALTAELTMSILIDKYGRKWVHVGSTFMVAVLGTALAYSGSYIAFVILRPFVAMMVVASLLSGVTMLTELFDSPKRAFAGIGLEYMWITSYMFTALMGYLIRDWRYLQMTLSLASLLGLIYICILPESPMWLAANYREKEAEQILQKMAKWNGVKAPEKLILEDGEEKKPLTDTENNKEDNVQETREQVPQQEARESVLDMFKDTYLRKYTIIGMLLWFANNIVYYFMILNAPALGSNLYMSFFLSGLVELPAYVLTQFVVKKGRRIPTCVFHVMAGVALAVISFIPSQTASGVNLLPLITTVALFGKFSITCSFALIILYTREFYPTNLRGTSGGILNVLGRIGNMIAPFAALAARRTPWIPNVILGVISLTVAFITLLLPETKDWPLPQTIEDVHLFSQGGQDAEVSTLALTQDRVRRKSSVRAPPPCGIVFESVL